MIFDGHADLLYDVTKWRQAGEDRVFERRHLPRLQAGQIGGLGLSIWTTVEQDSIWSAHPDWDGWRRTEEMMARAREELAECPWLALCTDGGGGPESASGGKAVRLFERGGHGTGGRPAGAAGTVCTVGCPNGDADVERGKPAGLRRRRRPGQGPDGAGAGGSPPDAAAEHPAGCISHQ